VVVKVEGPASCLEVAATDEVLQISLFFLELLERSYHFEELFPLYTTTEALSVTPSSKKIE
jgi:hypothetical protein